MVAARAFSLPLCERVIGKTIRVFIPVMAVLLGWGIPGGLRAQNPIVTENALTGNLPSEWDVSGVGDPSIQGFATDISVNRGSTISFKINTNATAYRIDIYRLGYYGGRGARKVATVNPSVSLPQTQPAFVRDAATGSRRLRELGGLRQLGGAVDCRLGSLHRPTGSDR